MYTKLLESLTTVYFFVHKYNNYYFSFFSLITRMREFEKTYLLLLFKNN